jgi:hypothetical protein
MGDCAAAGATNFPLTIDLLHANKARKGQRLRYGILQAILRGDSFDERPAESFARID